MLAYLAFKALAGRYPDALKSAQQNTRWKLDATLGLPCLEAEEGTFEEGHGVYAATVNEARRYAEDHQAAVYLVAPLPGKRAVVGEVGWRAEGALCLGPLTQENQPEVARLILAAAANGLPQVPAILRWAVAVASQAEGRLVCPPGVNLLDLWRNGEEMAWLESLLPYLDRAEDEQVIARRLAAMPDARYRFGLPLLRWAALVLSEASDELVTPKGVQLADLLDCADDKGYAAWLGRMARYLSAEQLSHACDAFLASSRMGLLVEARRVWLERTTLPIKASEGEMNHRRAWEVLALAKANGTRGCPQELLQAAFDFAVEQGDIGWVYQLGLYCDDARWPEALRGALLSVPHPEMLYLAGRDWSDECYSEAIAQALAKKMDKEYLYLAGRDWPDRRFCEAIARAMASDTDEYGLPIADPHCLYLAGRDWPDGRFTPEIAQALVATGRARYLYLAGRDWPDGRFMPEIAQALAKTRDAKHLYLAGRDWSDGRFDEAIVHALVETGDAKYLYLAGRDWPDRRFSKAITKALIKTKYAYYLYLSGKEWPRKRFNKAITQSLVKTMGLDDIYLAGLDWPDERFDKTLAYALVKAKYAHYIYLAGRDWPAGRFVEAMTQALLEIGDPQYLYLAGRDWPDECYSDEIRKALIRSGNANLLYLAGLSWPARRYTDDILQALININILEYLHLARSRWPAERVSDALAEALRESGGTKAYFFTTID